MSLADISAGLVRHAQTVPALAEAFSHAVLTGSEDIGDHANALFHAAEEIRGLLYAVTLYELIRIDPDGNPVVLPAATKDQAR